MESTWLFGKSYDLFFSCATLGFKEHPVEGILMRKNSIFMILHGIFVEEFFVGVSVNNEFCKFFIYLVDLA